MLKRIFSMVLVILMCSSIFTFSVAAATSASINATYTNGVVIVTGNSLTSGGNYTIRVVNNVTSGIKAMGQAMADGSGIISASITTGQLGTLTDYKVYVNNQDGLLVAQGSISSKEGSGSGSGNGGGSDNTSGNSEITVTDNGSSVTATLTVTGKTDQVTGKVTAKATNEAFLSLINHARNAETEGKKAIVEVKVKASSLAESAEIIIPRDTLNKMVNETNADLKVDADIVSITFDRYATESMNSVEATGDIMIGITKEDISALPEKVRNMVGNRPVYGFKITAGDSEIHNLGYGIANISIPYTLQPGEDKNAIVVYNIDDVKSKLQTVRGVYNIETGTVDFKTSHFSKYAIAYNKMTFTDVAPNSWYNNAVTFIAARGITVGIGENKFGPDETLTRGQFIVMLMRAYGIEPDEKPSDNFIDAGNTYYTNYLAAAKRLKISSGVGNNNFDPDSEISRQDMFTLFYRALNMLGEVTTSNTTGKTLADYSDAGEIMSYAHDAMESFVKSGIIIGSDGKLSPNDQSSRAQMAQILYNAMIKR